MKPSIAERPLVAETEKESDYLMLVPKAVMYTHWHFVSPVYGDRCAMKPSCSLYSRDAYQRFGVVKGTVLTFDRLMHEGNEHKVSPVVFDGKRSKYVVDDPVENNVFWWNEYQRKEKP